MNAIRRAALRVHGLRSRDRAWLLAQLGPDERSRVEPLLEELDGMEISAAAGSLETSEFEGAGERVGADESRPEEGGQGPAWRRALDAADTGALTQLLADEADCVVAALLTSGEWPWRERFLRSLPKPRRHELQQHIERRRVLPPALRDALVEVAGRRLAEPTSPRAKQAGFGAALDRELAQRRRRRRWRRGSSWLR